MACVTFFSFNTEQNPVISNIIKNWPSFFSWVTETRWIRAVQCSPVEMLLGFVIKKHRGLMAALLPPHTACLEPRQGSSWHPLEAQCPSLGLLLGDQGSFRLLSCLTCAHSLTPAGCTAWPLKPKGWAWSMVTLHTCLLVLGVCPRGITAASLWIQPRDSETSWRKQWSFWLFRFCLQVMKSFCKTAECQYEFYGFNLL